MTYRQQAKEKDQSIERQKKRKNEKVSGRISFLAEDKKGEEKKKTALSVSS